MDLESELARLKSLYEKEYINETEYRDGKKSLLSSVLPSGNTPAQVPSTPQGTAFDLAPNMEIGSSGTDRLFRLERRLGGGAMGEVWKAMDLAESKITGYPVWVEIKALLPLLSKDERHREALKREAINARRLTHRHIIRTYDWYEDKACGFPFLVMEYLEGGTLNDLLYRRGRLPYDETLEILAPIADALDYAWTEHKIVHRDIKPENIFVTTEGRLKLLDFGIAAQVRTTAHAVGLVGFESPGTLEYAAPEASARHKASPKLDIYALGIVTYELLEGERPFIGLRHPHTPPPLKPEVLNESQWQVLMHAMAYDAAERHDSGRNYLAELKRAEGPSAEEIEQQKKEEAAKLAAEDEDRRKAQEAAKRKAEDEDRARLQAKEREEGEAQERKEVALLQEARRLESRGKTGTSNELERSLTILMPLKHKLITPEELAERKKRLLDEGGVRIGSALTSFDSLQGTAMPLVEGMSIGPGTDRLFRLAKQLGGGAMGEVWKAEDIAESKIAGHLVWVAVKALLPLLSAGERYREAFKREAINAKKLAHPHIIRTYDWYEDKTGVGFPFLVMEYLEGQTLDQKLAQAGRFSYPETLDTLGPIVEALTYAWVKHSIVHRNINPANIYLTAEGELKLLDFCIAAQARDTATSVVGLVGFELPVPFGYAPPEAGANRKPNPRPDIYALGVLTYELLEGKLPFIGLREPRTPLPDKPQALNDEQWKVLKRAIAFEANDRYESARAFLSDLLRAQA